LKRPQDLRDRTYYLSNGVIRVGGRRVATSNANFTKGDIVGVVLDADQVGAAREALTSAASFGVLGVWGIRAEHQWQRGFVFG
jgi:hypothetical protein